MTSCFAIRSALPEDKGAVIALWQACELTRPWNDPVRDFDRAEGKALSDVLVGVLADDIVATVMVGLDGHRGWLYYLGVAPNRRRSGFGRLMVEAAEAWLRERGAPKVQLMVRETNAAVMAFYERLGYAHQEVHVLGRFFEKP
ncbi:MAG: GNAT family acetyltransferase [Fimbriimonadaceae bacterium]